MKLADLVFPSTSAMGKSCTNFPYPPFSPEFEEDVETHIEPCAGHMLQHLYIGVQYCPNIQMRPQM